MYAKMPSKTDKTIIKEEPQDEKRIYKAPKKTSELN
jgi:hypothetical protein